MSHKNSNTGSKFVKDLFVWTFVLAVLAAIAIADIEPAASQDDTIEVVASADVQPDQPQASGAEIIVAANVAPSSTGQEPDVGRPIQSFKFEENFSIRDALAILASMYQKNIVPSPSVDGVLAFRSLTNVTFEEAMSAILGDNFKYVQEGNLTKVYTRDEYKKIMEAKERMITKVFTLYYISAAEAMKLITPVLSGAHTIQGSSPTEKVMPTGESISVGSMGGDTMALNDHIVVRDYPENIEAAAKLLKDLDTRPKQVLVEATILSATLTEETALGIDWNTLNGIAVDTIANVGAGIADGLATGGFASAVKTTVLTSGGGLSAGITNDHVAVLIKALESVTDVTVLANPKILATNKQLGQVYIGKKIGYVSQTTQTQTSTTQQVEFLDTGVKLSFRPYIGNDGYIRMDIHPKDSDGTLKTNDIPDEQSTELATNIMVKDGQTIVIGGLFRDKVNSTRNQVPLLGDLPFVGAAFRGTSDTVKREEVIVMLTPHIIEEPQETEGLAREEDISRKRLAVKDELQWVDRARIAEEHYTKAVQFFTDKNLEASLLEVNRALRYRPTYLEAIQLKEKIIKELDPGQWRKLERKIRKQVEQESDIWLRR